MAPLMPASRILVTGGTGFLGRRACLMLAAGGAQIQSVSRSIGCDLRVPQAFESALRSFSPDLVVHLAAACGGIGANMRAPASFFEDNMAMGLSVVGGCARSRTRLLMVGTICSYPKDCPAPFSESSLWDGYPEPTNAPYGIAKKALLVLCQAHRAQSDLRFGYLMPCNLYGPGDNFSPSTSHVLPALVRKFEEARVAGSPSVCCWGTGLATRSFLHVDDCARAVVAAAGMLDDDVPVNLPGSPEISIADLAQIISMEVGYQGLIEWDPSKPDGQPRRSVDGMRARSILGWEPEVDLTEGIRATISSWRLSSGGRA